MKFDLIVKGADVVSASARFAADIGIAGGRIAAVGVLDAEDGTETYDASGMLVFPGFIDEHVHSREPGLEHKEDFAHSTRAAAAGGVTTVVEMPNSVPPVSDAASFRQRAELLGRSAFVDFAMWGIVLGDANTPELSALAEAGAVGFKLFWGYALDRRTLALVYEPAPGQETVPPPDDGQILEAFQAIAATGRPVAIHAENAEVIARLTRREREAGALDYAALLRSRPAYAEAMTIAAGIDLASQAGVHLHVLHVSSGDGADRIAEARRLGARVTAETCPHYLFLTAEDYPRLGTSMKVFPPIREARHRERLWQALASGAIQTVGSDHAPHTAEEKSAELWRAPAGAAVVQATVPLLLGAVSEGRLDLHDVAALLSENPARLLGLYGRKGVIAPGADADLTVVDPERPVTLRKDAMLSKSDVMPYDGVSVRGAPVAAFLRGRRIMQDGRLVDGERSGGRLVVPTARPSLR